MCPNASGKVEGVGNSVWGCILGGTDVIEAVKVMEEVVLPVHNVMNVVGPFTECVI